MRLPLIAAVAVILAGCQQPGSPDPLVGFGPNAPLPKPQKSFLLPMFDTPKAVGWPAGAARSPSARTSRTPRRP